jgi:hypothetical protein
VLPVITRLVIGLHALRHLNQILLSLFDVLTVMLYPGFGNRLLYTSSEPSSSVPARCDTAPQSGSPSGFVREVKLLWTRIQDYMRFVDLVACRYLEQCLVRLIALDICK